LKVINLESKESREILPGKYNYSYSDGDQHYQWSPDGEWFLVEYLPYQNWNGQAGLVKATGDEEPINLTKSGYTNANPRWSMKGNMMVWYSDRDGQTNHGSWGGEGDIYGMFFNQKAYERFTLSEEEYAILKEQEEEQKKKQEKEEGENDDKEGEEKEKIEPIEIELEDIEDRKVKLTIHSSDLGGAYVLNDGGKLFYLAKFEKGYDLWQTELRTKETKKLVSLNAKSVSDLQADKEEKHLFFLADGNIVKIELESAKKEQVGFNGKMEVWADAEREYLFDHVWRQVKKKFYKKDLHGVDWDFYRDAYERFLPHINNNADFAELLSEMLGELNASHTGARYRKQMENPDATASLGLYIDESKDSSGLYIVEVMDNGPADKSDSRIAAGQIVEKIDGQAIPMDVNYFRLLNQKAGQATLLSLYDPETDERWEETVKPVSLGKEGGLRYERWVDQCRHIVDSLSDGEIGYVHIRGMNDESYRVVYEEVLGRHANKKALVVDTRFNGGGWLHDDLVTFLSGEEYITFMPRGQYLGEEPQFKWRRPSVVVMSESNYSDAHMFPFAYKELNIGKLVGMPVPGTGTAVWWERLHTGDLVFGIPQVGMLIKDGQYLENTELQPDIKVPNEPDKVREGRDQQLEAAVRELERQVGEE
jgi:C-terminal processing protease CtpA/Prc